MLRRSSSVLLLASLLSGCSAFHNLPPEKRRAVILSLDGGGEQVIDHLIADGAMPNLAKLRGEGVQAEYSRTNYPSKTSAGHAALWTGGYGDTDGVTSNKVLAVPLNQHTILETHDGFDSRELFSEPIWVTAARAGRRAVVLQATHVSPLSTYAPGGRFGIPFPGSLTLMDGYGGVDAKEAVYATPPASWPAASDGNGVRGTTFDVDGVPFGVAALDDPTDPVAGLDTVAIAGLQGPAVTVKPNGGWSAPVWLKTPKGNGHCNFRLFSLKPDGSELVLYRTPVVEEQGNKAEALMAFYGPYPFIPQGAIASWDAGKLGKKFWEGGDGTAEARYLDSVDFLLDEGVKRAQVLMQRKDWDLAVTYQPFPDEALHAWYGFVDANSPSYDAKLAPRVWKLLDHVGAACDRYIGALRSDPDTIVAVASDHGFAGLKWKFFVNTALRDAGLLRLTKDGHVDLSHTLAFYPATDGTFIVVNHKGHKGGIVPATKVNEVLERVETALKKLKAEDGTPLVTGFVRPGRNDVLPAIQVAGTKGVYDELGVGGIRGGDLYLDLHPGYNYSPEVDKKELTAAYDPGQGGHVFDPRRADMHAALSLAGPGIKRGAKIGPVRNIDLAPTVCHLLGMPAPSRAMGRVLTEALTP